LECPNGSNRSLGDYGFIVSGTGPAVPQRLPDCDPHLDAKIICAMLFRYFLALYRDFLNGGVFPLLIGPMSVVHLCIMAQ